MEQAKAATHRALGIAQRLRPRHIGLASSTSLDVGLVAAVVLLVSSPALFTDQPFMLDYANSLWLAWVQGHAIASGIVPSYFLHTTGGGIFDPLYAFYGGTAWSTFGATQAILGGNAVIAFVGVTAVAVAAAYGGTLWLARQCGVPGLLAHVPALVFPTSAYYVANLYGRGDLAEFMATSAIPLLIASAVHLLRAERWTPLPALAFLGSIVIFTGSHNITLLWGTIVGVFAAVLLAALVRPKLPRLRRFAGLIGLSCLGLAVNAWYLLPDVFYAARTSIVALQRTYPHDAASFFNTPEVLFYPWRALPAGYSAAPGLYVQLPVWFLLWACGAGVFVWTRASGRSLTRVWLGIAVLIVVLLALIFSKPVWDVMPAPLTYIQFAYRLVTFVTLAITGLVLVGTVAIARSRGRAAQALRVSAAGAALISVSLCWWQVWVLKTEPAPVPAYYASRSQALVSVTTFPPMSWYAGIPYADHRARLYPVAPNRAVTIDPRLVHRDRFSGWIAFPAGTAPVLTNIVGGSYLVRIEGLRRLGRNSQGYAVVQRTEPGSGPVHVVIETAASGPVQVGRWLSAVGLLGSLIVVVALALRSRVQWLRRLL